MGQASNFMIIILSVNLIMGMLAISIQAIDPTSQLLYANQLFGTTGVTTDNMVVSSINNASGVYSYDWNNTQYDNLGAEDTSIVGTSTSAFPDWIRSGWSWTTTVGRTYINFVGAPFTIASGLGLDTQLSALFGAFFGIIGTFIMLNWLLGRET